MGFRRARVSWVILATLCSKPQVTNAKRHQKIMIKVPASDLHLNPHHTARQTSILHRMPRIRSGRNGIAILPAAAVAKNVAVTSLFSPEYWNKSAITTDPAQLPSQQTIQSLIASRMVVFFLEMPATITRLLPVNSSAPAMITRDNAIPNAAPITILVCGAPFSMPPITLISTLPNPI